MSDRTSAVSKEEVHRAFQRWSRTVFAAPRRIADLIVDIAPRDEVIERLAVRVRQRKVIEKRAPTAERRATTPPLDPSELDPFAFTNETLRITSQHVAPCETCRASGVKACDGCKGTCTARCPNCSGTGKDRSEKTGRPINCKVCKKTGRVPCWPCSGRGHLACSTCMGSGHQLAWLTLEESGYWAVTLLPTNSPIAIVHRVLRENRPLKRSELGEFAVVDETTGGGALNPVASSGPHRTLVSAMRAAINERLERIEEAQHLRLAITRRDVSYAMCGTTGTVTLSGTTLVGARTPEAVRPIKRRLLVWPAMVVLVATLAVLLRSQFVGSSRYFEGAQGWSAWLVLVAIACAIPSAGTMLRLWKSGLRFRRFPRATVAASAVVGLSLAGIVAVGILARPDQADVRSALATGNPVQAREVLEGLKEFSEPGGRGLLELEDQVMLAEAAKEQGRARLVLLDAVAARGGSAAAEAAAAARRERLSQIHRLLQAKDSAGALSAIDEWFPRDNSVEVIEERARAHELRVAACGGDPCRLAASMEANSARTTPERQAQVAAMRAKVLDAISVERVTETNVGPRLQQARRLHAAATETLGVVKSDADVRTRAGAAIAFVEEERAKVPVLGKDLVVANELLGPSTTNERGVPTFELDGASVLLAMTRSGTCRGVYVVGAPSAGRAFQSSTWSAEHILSQVLGRPATLKAPPSGAAISKWSVGGVPVVARWRLGRVVELRIGDAQP